MSRKARLTASRRRRCLGRDTDSDTDAFGLPLNENTDAFGLPLNLFSAPSENCVVNRLALLA